MVDERLEPPRTTQTPWANNPTPMSWRLALLGMVVALASLSYAAEEPLGVRGRSALGLIAFLALVAAFSANLRAVSWRAIGWGIALQLVLALFVLKTDLGYSVFSALGEAIGKFLQFSDEGAKFVFGVIADKESMGKVFGPANAVVFFARVLPPIIFVSSFFTVLYYFGILQIIVRAMARAMMFLMRTSGAETLSSAANVFMGQTEAPLIIKPYLARMTQSELLAVMVGGMATISGGIMAVYIEFGADKVAILATSVMAAPCSLYLAKLLLPETEQPVTRGVVHTPVDIPYRNAVDAAASGATDGMHLAFNVAAMLIAFLAIIAFADYLLIQFGVGLQMLNDRLGGVVPSHVDLGLSLRRIFSWVFAPIAHLMGVVSGDVPAVADLLGTKLVANEFVAYIKLTSDTDGYRQVLSPRSFKLATYALTGFANFASIGIQIGGIGALAPERRPDLARLGMRALFVGFLATVVNASLAGMLME
jgi:CNT family concentrative nucleoside transporter